MKPVAIFRHASTEGPGHFATFLERQGIPYQLIAIDAGAVLPDSPQAYSGLVFMGGPMSVNDDLPWIGAALCLIRAAVAADIPVLGHCLGGQLMAKAMGGSVGANPVKEIGWGAVRVLGHAAASSWFGQTPEFEAFHWHGETFSLPKDAIRVLESEHCQNQAFVLNDRHLGMQCHVEMTEAMIRTWCEVGAAEIEQALASGQYSAVQPAEQILAQSATRLGAMTEVADRLYGRWIQGLAL